MSSSPAANPQHEPTMEEILASIRKIISEDQPEAAKPATASASPPTPLRAVPNEPASAPMAAAVPAADMDVLELTEEVEDEAPISRAPEPAPPEEGDIAFETIEETPAKAEQQPPMDAETDDLISNSTRSLVSRAFANMDKAPVEYTPPPAGTLDALFQQAVQSAFKPTLKEWVDGHNDDIMNSLKPLIRAWMDEHLPPLIEAAVAKEITRAAGERPRRR